MACYGICTLPIPWSPAPCPRLDERASRLFFAHFPGSRRHRLTGLALCTQGPRAGRGFGVKGSRDDDFTLDIRGIVVRARELVARESQCTELGVVVSGGHADRDRGRKFSVAAANEGQIESAVTA